MKKSIFVPVFLISAVTLISASVLTTCALYKSLDTSRSLFSVFTLTIPVIIIAIAVSAFFSALLTVLISKKITSSLNSLDIDNPATGSEYAEQMRREFTANVSHELKTPLHSISGYAELLKSGIVKDEDISLFAGRIYSETQRMIALVEDIIRLSHLDEGSADMKKENINLYEISSEVINVLRPAAEEAKVSISLHGSPAQLIGYPQLVSGIVHNLCDNAIKYNRKNGSVDVEVRNTDRNVILTVSDNGIGIPEEHRERVFERFYRVDKSHSKEVGGTGLGLSIVKHSARIHNAELTLDSIADGGTTITVKFPKQNT
ncbi:MAG: hypothetical protein E7505_06650 [Ruminococcus sp.]|nr:hypothetical protein [Ruminococcus sp.]